MKKILNLLGMFVLSFLMVSGYSYSQNNQQTKRNQNRNQNMKTQNSTQADANYDKSMAYYKYAKKNIIEDKSKDEIYKGKFHDQNKMGMNNSNMNSSNKNMMNSNGMKMDTKHHMGKKRTHTMMDTGTSKTKKH